MFDNALPKYDKDFFKYKELVDGGDPNNSMVLPNI